MSDLKKLKADMQFARLRHDSLGTAETLETLRRAENAYQEETDGDKEPVKEVPASQQEPAKEEKPKPASKPAKATEPAETPADTQKDEQEDEAEVTEEKKTDS